MGENAKVPPASSGRILACSIAVLLWANASGARGEEAVWIGPESGNWSIPTNWQNGAVPLSDPALTLRFTAVGSSAISATKDFVDSFSLGGLQFESNSKGLFTLAGNALRLTGAAPKIMQAGIGNATLSAPLLLDPSPGGAVTIGGTGAGDLTLSGTISEAGGPVSLVIAGQTRSLNDQIISLTGANSTTGGITLESGNLAVGVSALGTGNAPLVVKGGSLRFTRNLSFTTPISLHSDLLLVGLNNVSLGSISSAVAGTGLNVRMNAPSGGLILPQLTLTQPTTYTGATRIDYDPGALMSYSPAANLLLTGLGQLTGTSLVDVRSAGTLTIGGSSTTGALNRLPDAATVELHSGRLVLKASSGLATPQVETIGPLKVAGQSVVTVDVSASSGASGQITAASLERLGKGTLLLRGIPTGAAPAAASSRGKVVLTSSPTDMVGSGGTMPIVPYAIGDSSLTGNGSGLVTYTPGVGLRLLDINEYATAFSTQNGNVRLTSNADLANRTINSLVIASGYASGLGKLTISSGVVLSTSTTSSFINYNLDFGSRDGRIFNAGDFSISGVISGSGGLTKSSDGTLTLTRNNTFTGPLTISGGLVSFNSAGQLGNPASPIVMEGHNAGLFLSAGTVTLDREFILNSGMGRLRTNEGTTLEVSGQISGAGGLRLNSGFGGTVRLTGNNTFTGPVMMGFGTLEINSDAALGVGGELSLGNDTFRLLAPVTSDRTINLYGSISTVTIDTGEFDGRLNGFLHGDSPLIKIGSGTLTLTRPGTYAGAVSVRQGTIALAEAAAFASTSFSASQGAILHSDQTAAGSLSHLNEGSTVTLDSGVFAITGRAGAVAAESIGTLRTFTGSQFNTLALTPGGEANSGVALSVSSLSLGGRSLLIRADNLGGAAGEPFSRFALGQHEFIPNSVAAGIYNQGLAGGPEFLTTYDSATDGMGTIGLRRVQMVSTAFIQNPDNGGTTPETANLFVPVGTTAAVGVRNTINSLTFASGGDLSLAAEQTLKVESGSVLRQSGTGVASILGGVLDFGHAPATFATFSNLAVSSALRGSGPLTKFGAGKLTLSGPLDQGGLILLAEGSLHAGNGAVFGKHTVRLDTGTVLGLDLASAPVALGSVEGTGAVVLGTSPLILGGAGKDILFSGTFNGTGLLTIVDGGSPGALRSFAGLGSFAGNVVLESGRLQLLAPDALGLGILTVRGGALLVPSAPVPINNPIALESDLVITGQGTVPLTLSPSSSIAGPHSLYVQNPGGLTINGAAAHSGETRVMGGAGSPPSAPAGTLLLAGVKGALTGTSAIHIGPRGSFVMDNGTAFTGGPGGRVPDSSPIFLNGAEIRLNFAQGAAAAETVGPLHGRGFSTVTVGHATGAQLTAASLVREERGTFFFRGPALTATGTGNAVRFSSSLAGDLVGGGGTGAEVSILPYGIGDKNGSADVPELVTYDDVRGIRLLDPLIEYAGSLAAATPTSNVRLTSASELNGTQTINSLHLSAPLTGAGTLAITSGVVLMGNFNSWSVTPNLSFGPAEANLFVTNAASLSLRGIVSGSGGLTKSGSGTLWLTNANTVTGPLTLNGGNVMFNSMESFGPDTSPIRMNANAPGQGLWYTGQGPFLFSRDIELVGGFGALRHGTGSDQVLEVSGTISGIGGLSICGVKLTGANTYTGPTVVQGTLGINSDTALGASTSVLEFSGSDARLQLNGPWTTSRRVVASTSAQLLLKGHAAILHGPLEGTAPFSVTGPGSVTLTADSPFSGQLTLSSDFALSGAGAIRSTAVVSSFGSLVIDNRAVASSDRLLDTGSITTTFWPFTLIGNSDTLVRERIGAFDPSSFGLLPGIRLISPGEAPTILEAASYVAQSSLTTVGGDRLGETSGGFTRLTFETLPELKGGLLPSALAANSPDGLPDSFAFYDTNSDEAGVIGVRPLREGEYDTSTILRNPMHGGATPTDGNVLATSTVSLGADNVAINSLTIRGSGELALGAAQTLSIANGMVLVQGGASGVITGGALDFGSAARLLVNGSISVDSALTASIIEKHGPGTLRLDSPAGISGDIRLLGGTLVLAGTVTDQGGQINPVQGTTLAGNVDIQRSVSLSGTLSPGENDTGVMKMRALQLNHGSALSMEIASASAFDRLELQGTLTLRGPVTLSLSLSFDPADGLDAFTLIANDGIDPVVFLSGALFTFEDRPLSEGATFFVGAQDFRISYAGGDGNDVVLYAVPEPSAAALLLTGLARFLRARRRSRRR